MGPLTASHGCQGCRSVPHKLFFALNLTLFSTQHCFVSTIKADAEMIPLELLSLSFQTLLSVVQSDKRVADHLGWTELSTPTCAGLFEWSRRAKTVSMVFRLCTELKNLSV